MMKRCIHDRINLFDPPAAGNRTAEILYFLNPWTRHEWVICRKCGVTGYWGGYGIKRRVRWGYGGDQVLQAAHKATQRDN